MAIYTVEEIQDRISTTIDQSASAPTDTTDEYAWRLKFINRSNQEWSRAWEWEALRKEKFLSITGVSGASISLPGDFDKMAMFPINWTSDTDGESWPEIRPEERQGYDESDKYFYVLGAKGDKTMVWNPGTLSSGASILISYFSFATSLASPANTLLMANPEFVVERSIAYIFEARGDARFQEMEAKARETLLQMIENDKSKGLSLLDDVKTTNQMTGFRIGRN